MKANPKRIFVLILALVLALGMINGSFSEESVPEEPVSTSQPNAFGVAAEGMNILLLISDDENDTVLENYGQVVRTAVAIFASAFEGTNTTLTLQPVSDEAEAIQILPLAVAEADPAVKPDIAETVDAAFASVEDNVNKNKLDSMLCGRLDKLSGADTKYDRIILITNGEYVSANGTPYKNYNNISLPLTVVTLYSEGTSGAKKIKGVAEKFGGEAVYVSDATALAVANQMLVAVGLPELKAYLLSDGSNAESLMNVCGYLVNEQGEASEAEAYFTANPPVGGRTVVGTVKADLQLRIIYPDENSTDAAEQNGDQSEGDTTDAAAEPVDSQPEEAAADEAGAQKPIQIVKGSGATFSAEASEGLTLDWKLLPPGAADESEFEAVFPDANGFLSIKDLEDGVYTLTLTGTCGELGITRDAKPYTFQIVSPPVYRGPDECEAKNSLKNPDVFVTELSQTAAFDNDNNLVAAAVQGENSLFTAQFDENGCLTITRADDSASASDAVSSASETPESISVELTAQNKNGLKDSKVIKITLCDIPAEIEGMQLDAKWTTTPSVASDDSEWYTAGTKITASVTPTKDSASLIAETPDWAGSVSVKVSTDGTRESAKELVNNPEGGWTYTTTAAEGMPALTFYINENSSPAGTLSAPTVYPKEKLTEGLLQESTLIAEPDADSYELNEDYTITVSFDDLSALQAAPDWKTKSSKITVTYKDADNNDVPLEGSPKEGWTLTGTAHEDTTYTFELKYDKQVVEVKTATINVKPAPFYIRLACMLNGKEDWEFDASNGILRSPDMLRVYIAAGILLLLIIILIVIIKAATKQRFRENTSIEITVKTAERSYEGRPVDLEPWGKKAVSFGALVGSSALPPISLLMDGDVMNKITFRPVRGGVRVDNRSNRLSGGDREILTRDSNVVRLSGDQNIIVIIRYQ